MSHRVHSVAWQDRAIGIAGLLTVTALAWAYVLHLAAGMNRISDAMMMSQAQPWDWREALGLFVMWAVMMTAMMIPSAAPMILLFGQLSRRRRAQGIAAAAPGVFGLGYLLTWFGYSALASGVQWLLHSKALLSGEMVSQTPLLGAAVLFAAGIYQWLPLKQRCLAHCRSPLGFFSTEWREGNSGALLMGLRHGSYCVGCCWLLMALLFVTGIMNLLWVAVLSAVVLVEKLAPGGRIFGRLTGGALIGWGFGLLLARL